MKTEHDELHGTWHPSNYILAVVDTLEEAEAAKEALQASGFHAEDLNLMHGQEAVQCLDIECKHCGLLKHMVRFMWRFLTFEGFLLKEYENEGKAGRQVLGVHVHQNNEMELAHHILVTHHAHHIEYFGKGALGSITRLEP